MAIAQIVCGLLDFYTTYKIKSTGGSEWNPIIGNSRFWIVNFMLMITIAVEISLVLGVWQLCIGTLFAGYNIGRFLVCAAINFNNYSEYGRRIF